MIEHPDEDPTYEAAVRATDRRALDPVRDQLERAGFYAYASMDDTGRWTVSVDDERGHIDVRIGADGFAIELWGVSPGLYADEENDFRRKTRERLVRMTLPALNRGLLEPHQAAEWDEAEGGVLVRLRYELPFTRLPDIAAFARGRLDELEDTLTLIESNLN